MAEQQPLEGISNPLFQEDADTEVEQDSNPDFQQVEENPNLETKDDTTADTDGVSNPLFEEDTDSEIKQDPNTEIKGEVSAELPPLEEMINPLYKEDDRSEIKGDVSTELPPLEEMINPSYKEDDRPEIKGDVSTELPPLEEMINPLYKEDDSSEVKGDSKPEVTEEESAPEEKKSESATATGGSGTKVSPDGIVRLDTLLGVKGSIRSTAELTADEKALLEAAGRGDLARVKELVHKGVNINTYVRYIPSEYGDDKPLDRGWRPIHWAVKEQHIDIVRFLLENNADVNPQTGDGETPLYKSCCTEGGEDIELVKLLLEHKADLYIPTDLSGLTPAHIAAVVSRIETLELLYQYGLDVNVQGKFGHTPLHFAAQNEKLEVVTWLLDKGADINAKTNSGATPLDECDNMFSGKNKAYKMIKKRGGLRGQIGSSGLPLGFRLWLCCCGKCL